MVTNSPNQGNFNLYVYLTSNTCMITHVWSHAFWILEYISWNICIGNKQYDNLPFSKIAVLLFFLINGQIWNSNGKIDIDENY